MTTDSWPLPWYKWELIPEMRGDMSENKHFTVTEVFKHFCWSSWVPELPARFCWSNKVVTWIQIYGMKKKRLQNHHEFSQQQKATSGCYRLFISRQVVLAIFIHELRWGLAVKWVFVQFLRDYQIREYHKELFMELRRLCEQTTEWLLKNQY